eukprot:CFRG7271T1
MSHAFEKAPREYAYRTYNPPPSLVDRRQVPNNSHHSAHSTQRVPPQPTRTSRISQSRDGVETVAASSAEETYSLLQRLCEHLVERQIRVNTGVVSQAEFDHQIKEKLLYSSRRLESHARAGGKPATGVAEGMKTNEGVKRELNRAGRKTDAIAFDHLFTKLCACPAGPISSEIIRFLWALRGQSTVEEPEDQYSSDNANPAISSGDRSNISGIAHRQTARNERNVDPSLDPTEDYRGQPSPNPNYRRERAEWNENPERSAIVHDDDVVSAGSVPEPELVRDVIYLLQGINGEFIKIKRTEKSAASSLVYSAKPVEPTFSRPDDYHVEIHKAVNGPIRRLIMKQMAPVGLSYKFLDDFVNNSSKESSLGGIVYQSLLFKVRATLSAYYQLIAVLQDQFLSDSQINTLPGTSPHTPTYRLTLKRLLVWCHTPGRQLAFVCNMVQHITPHTGGALLSALNEFTYYGDTELQSLAVDFVEASSSHLYYMMRRWVYDGELEDPFGEFFVIVNEDIQDDSDNVWKEKHDVDETLVPNFIPMETARKILQVGKSVYFIRQCCADFGTIMDSVTRERDEVLFKHGHLMSMQKALDHAYSVTGARVLSLLHEKFHLGVHMRALKRYLLLAQGDFVQALMETLDAELSAPATEMHLYSLAGSIHTAKETTTAKYDDEFVINRLDVRLEAAGREAQTGYDLFLLDYHVDGPIKVVFTGGAMHQYHRLFRQLWRLKRLERCLSSAWEDQNDISKRFNYITRLYPLLHRCNILSQAMRHFVSKMQYFLMFEVLETATKRLNTSMAEAKDLDQIIDAHNRFLSDVVNNSLLGDQSTDLFDMIKSTASIILAFCDFLKNFKRMAETEHESLQHAQSQRDERSRKGEWAVTQKDKLSEKEHAEQFEIKINRFRQKVDTFDAKFRSRAKGLVDMLSSSQTTNLRSLAIRLDYSGYFLSLPH